MTDETRRAIAQLQEPPPLTTLPEPMRSRYLAVRAAIAVWEPRPCPPRSEEPS